MRNPFKYFTSSPGMIWRAVLLCVRYRLVPSAGRPILPLSRCSLSLRSGRSGDEPAALLGWKTAACPVPVSGKRRLANGARRIGFDLGQCSKGR